VLTDLCAWAKARRAAGGAWIKVRLVKGANLAMEQVEAELGGWPQAPYPTKREVDASYKRMLDVALDAGAAADLRIGVGSHNLFDVAWALVLRDDRDAVDRVELEMLEGMAPAQARAARQAAGDLLLYAPVVERHDFAASIAYLSRRLDENAAPENFLRSLFTLRPGSSDWVREQDRFETAVADRLTVAIGPRRTQDRSRERRSFDPGAEFANEPDTDFVLPANRAWIEHHLANERPAPRPPLVTTTDGIDATVARARGTAGGWAARSPDERRAVLNRCAEVMADNRGHTLAVMAHETGKTVREGDPEVSEAIDFTRWSAHETRILDDLAADGVSWRPRGVVVVAGPWNFPYAIPTNGVVSALATGNAVILKPAPESVATGAEIVRHLHEGGVPADVVQLVTCPDDHVGRHLITHDEVDTVVLTGSYDTARLFLGWKPGLRLLAETSGKNALVITAAADIDLAIKDLVRSAFGHAGQKCSAASLAIIEAGVYDNPGFRTRLADAVRSLRVGPAEDLATMMGPLINPPAGPLARALAELDPGESWLVEPRRLDDEGRYWTPGVKLGVAPGSWFHVTECFGPVLGLMRADDLDHALELQNATGYGLTGGLHSLDPGEIDRWVERVEVGNAYVNRHTTGAIVRRQPFGGWKRSSLGPGAKTGGPEDVLRFVRFDAAARLSPSGAAASYVDWWRRHYGAAIDASGLRSESNVLRYHPVAGVIARLDASATDEQVAVLRSAATTVGVALELSVPAGASAVDGVDGVDMVVEDEADLAARLGATGAERLRALAPIGDALASACHNAGITIDDTPLTGHGRVELHCWLKEQAVSRTLHRHGRVPG
jgi:RHH-type proline utilization regulon transcriptional repressor/proline dehydrogenase/delta 1-pyrroline-5-carboxylate dehydrogenase